MGLIVVAAGLGLLLGLGQSEERRFERAAASEISSKLGGDEKKVRVNGSRGLGDVYKRQFLYWPSW